VAVRGNDKVFLDTSSCRWRLETRWSLYRRARGNLFASEEDAVAVAARFIFKVTESARNHSVWPRAYWSI